MSEQSTPIADSLCNSCGEPMTPSGLKAKVLGGYNSTPGNGDGALDDCTSYQFNMCEFCLDFLFSQFKIPPTTRDIHGDLTGPWKPAALRVTEDAWRKMKDEFFSLQKQRAIARGQDREKAFEAISVFMRSRCVATREEYFNDLVGLDSLVVLEVALHAYDKHGNSDRLSLAAGVLAEQGEKAYCAFSWLIEHKPEHLLYFADAIAVSEGLSSDHKKELFTRMWAVGQSNPDLMHKLIEAQQNMT